jgi:hypothetical protein
MPEPDLETMWKDAERVREFWDEHYEEFLHDYPERFVAVRDGKVVATSEDLFLLADKLAALGLDRVRDVHVEFISSRWGELLL